MARFFNKQQVEVEVEVEKVVNGYDYPVVPSPDHRFFSTEDSVWACTVSVKNGMVQATIELSPFWLVEEMLDVTCFFSWEDAVLWTEERMFLLGSKALREKRELDWEEELLVRSMLPKWEYERMYGGGVKAVF